MRYKAVFVAAIENVTIGFAVKPMHHKFEFTELSIHYLQICNPIIFMYFLIKLI
jgi:hypothetical protein